MIMKKILLSLIAVVALCYSTQAQIPTYAAQQLLNFTNTASTATNLSAVIDCRKQASVTIQWIAGCSASSTASNSIFLQYSVDGVNYNPTLETTEGGQKGKRITQHMNGITPVILTTNINTFGVGYIKVIGGTNSHATADSTNMLAYAIKIQSP